MSGRLDAWVAAKSPNYNTNKDKFYPYSELLYLGKYNLVKIPFCIKNLIEHVDYYGRGRIETRSSVKGFSDCYNVNHEYSLVDFGPDKGRKIPNRIPLSENITVHETSNYIKDNSVLTVTVTGEIRYLTRSAIKDIVRIVNSDLGKVIIYGLGVNNNEENNVIETLSEELKKMKQLFYCPIYLLPEYLQQPYYNTCYLAYLSLNELKKELNININRGDHEAAFILTRCLSDVYAFNALGEVVNKLLENGNKNVMTYAYKLWYNNAKDIVCKHFPAVFKLIFNEDCMMIVNKQYNQALKLCEKQAWGDNHDKTSYKVNWKVAPILEDNNVMFKLYNVGSNMFLKLASGAEGSGDTQTSDLTNHEESSNKFYLEPAMINGEVVFTISDIGNGRCLELDAKTDSSGDRALLGHRGVVNNQRDHFMWILAAWNQLTTNSESNLSVHNCP